MSDIDRFVADHLDVEFPWQEWQPVVEDYEGNLDSAIRAVRLFSSRTYGDHFDFFVQLGNRANLPYPLISGDYILKVQYLP